MVLESLNHTIEGNSKVRHLPGGFRLDVKLTARYLLNRTDKSAQFVVNPATQQEARRKYAECSQRNYYEGNFADSSRGVIQPLSRALGDSFDPGVDESRGQAHLLSRVGNA